VRASRSAGSARRLLHAESFDVFDSILVELSDAFARAPASGTAVLIDEWLARLAPLVRVERITLWELSADGGTSFNRHSYASAGCEAAPGFASIEHFSWLVRQSLARQIVAWSRIPDDVPAAAARERQYALESGAKSLLSIPVATDTGICVVAFVAVLHLRKWSPALVNRLRLAAGVLAGAVGRERTASQLLATEARNRALLTALPDLMLVVSAAGVYLDVHCRDESELLLPPEKLVGLRLEDTMPQQTARLFRESFATLVQPGDTRLIEYAMPIRGERREYEARVVLRDDGALVCIIRNITERNRALRSLRESEERFRGAFEHSAIGIALVALDGRWLKTNGAISRILGYSEAELRALNFQTLTYPDDLEPDMKLLQQVLRGEIEHFEMEKRYIHKEGRTIPAFLTVSVVRDEERRPLYFVSQIQDLSERHRAQLENERLRIELNHFGRLALIGQLTASLAHEVVQPIASARANARACQRLLETADQPLAEVREGLDDIVANCTRAADIVNHVRSLLRKELKPRRPLDLNQLVREVSDVMRHELLLRKVRLVLNLQSDLPEIMGNSTELQQVILNLLLNGADALQGSTRSRVILVETAASGERVELAIHDSGTGAQPAALKRMFEPFFTTKAEGMGMGLAICTDIVHSHGGTILPQVNSTGGLTMRCVFPAVPKP
jgi:two-component system, sporulation sensor kinase A